MTAPTEPTESADPTETDALRATGDSYDTVAASYAELVKLDFTNAPLDLAMLTEFSRRVRASGPVADLGCGPGHVTAYLNDAGVQAFGLDLSPGMIRTARRRHPGLTFEVGTMTALDLPDAHLAGAISWYSIVHTPLVDLPQIFKEFHRVLAPGGHLLLAFKAGDRRSPLPHAYGHDVSLTVHWHPPAQVADLLSQAGLTLQAELTRAPGTVDKGPQSFLLARKPPLELSPA